MASGVKVVGGTPAGADEMFAAGSVARPDVSVDGAVDDDGPPEVDDGAADADAPEVAADESMPRTDAHARAARRVRARRPRARRWVTGLAILAILGLAGTIWFGVAWAGLQARQTGESQARASARSFLVDLTNFNAKTVDADFGAITSMSTGTFATQAKKFFNSSIRQDLEKALASSRGQVRSLYVQSYGGGQATVYAVLDQLYVNNKITSPQTDVLRVVVTMHQVGGRWKVADVTVLQGPSLGSSTATATSATATSTTATSARATSSSGTSASTSKKNAATKTG